MNGDYAGMQSHVIQSVDKLSSQTNRKQVEYGNISTHAKRVLFLRFTELVLKLIVAFHANSSQIVTIPDAVSPNDLAGDDGDEEDDSSTLEFVFYHLLLHI